jgi:hypothetical protein
MLNNEQNHLYMQHHNKLLLLYWLFVEDAINLMEHKSPPLESQFVLPHQLQLWEYGGTLRVVEISPFELF